MNCNDESTTLDQTRPHASSEGTSSSAAGDEQNLYSFIDRDQIFGLNLSDPAQAKLPIKPWDERGDTERYAESGVDDQFVITVPFTCSVRVKSILLNPGRGDFAPQVSRQASLAERFSTSFALTDTLYSQRIRAYVNRPSGIDFDDIEASSSSSIPDLPSTSSSSSIEASTGITVAPIPRPPPSAVGNVGSGKPQADFALLEDAPGVTEYPVSIARFNNTNSISVVFVSTSAQSTQGGMDADATMRFSLMHEQVN